MADKAAVDEEKVSENNVEEATDRTYFTVACNPNRIYAARYVPQDLPIPHPGPVQEFTFDLGVTAVNGAVVLSGVVMKGYNGHQLLFEQRWPAKIIEQKVGMESLRVEADMGLALRNMHFMLHGFEPVSMLEITVVGKVADEVPDPAEKGPPIQHILQVPVVYPEQKTDLHFPLRGTWWAIQAADWSDQHKLEVFSQPYAVDFVKLGPDNRIFRGDGLALEDHYSWDEPVYATAGGKVAHVGYDMPDLPPGMPPDPRMFQGDPRRLLGNAVAISHANGEFSYFAHLKQASVQVREGDLIKRGTLLGYVGNSGQSPGPQLHFHLMEGPNLFVDQGLPLKFSHFEAAGIVFKELTVIPTRMIVSSLE